MEQIKKVTNHLPCELTEEEFTVKSRELANTVQSIGNEENRQKNVKDQLKATMSELESRQSRLASVVSSGEEYRDVEVGYYYDSDTDKIHETRLDTGELLIARSIRDEERQLILEPVNEPDEETD